MLQGKGREGMSIPEKLIFKQALKGVTKEYFLEQLKVEWSSRLNGKDFNVDEEAEESWGRITSNKRRRIPFDVLKITKEDIKEVLREIKGELSASTN